MDEADTLRLSLTRKDSEMKEMEEKYRKYLEKAKTVRPAVVCVCVCVCVCVWIK